MGKRAAIERHDDAVFLAWTMAGLNRAKKLPKLTSLLVRKPVRTQTRHEQQAMFQLLAAQLKTVPRKTRLVHVSERSNG